MKEQENSPEKLDEMEASNLSDRKFRVMILGILKSMEKDIETIKKDQLEIENEIPEINNTLEGINSGLDEAGVCISDLEDKIEKKHPGRAPKRKQNFKK